MGQSCSSNSQQLGPDETGVSHFKIVVIGPPASGKSSFIRRYMENQFSREYVPTERAQILKSTKGINLPHYGLVSITLWDCPGEEDIDLRGTYYRDADAALVMCDLSQKDSLEAAPKWKDDFFRIGTETIHNYLRVEGVWVDSPESQPISELVPVVLVGTKHDLVWDGENKELYKMLDKFAESHKFKAGIPVTSRFNDGSVLQALQTLVRLLLERKERGDQDADDVKVEAALAGTGDSAVGLSSKTGPPDYGLFGLTNQKKMDDLFARANPCYARLLEWQYHFTLGAKKLRQYCGQAGILAVEEEMEEVGEDESWDNMLVALRNEAVKQFKAVKLGEDELDGHMLLEGLDMTDADIPPSFDREEDEWTDVENEGEEEGEKEEREEKAKEEKKKRQKKATKKTKKEELKLTMKQKVFVILTHFNLKLSPVLHIINKDGPLLVDFLRALDSKVIAASCEVPPAMLSRVETNRVRLTQLEFQIRELLEMVRAVVQKMRIVFN